jgi:periplasmic divalent cation tolerance protein
VKPVVALTTTAADYDAALLARTLVEEQLVACVNVVDRITSIYRWENSIHEDGEKLLVMKTTTDRLDALRDRLMDLHPYDVPEFIVIPVTEASAQYERWLIESTRAQV